MSASPPRGDLHQFIGQEAARVTAEFRAIKGQKGKFARRGEWMIKGEAMDLLGRLRAPIALTVLFDAMLGGVAHNLSEMNPAYHWIEAAADFEARQDCEATNSQSVDKVVMPANLMLGNRQWVLKEVRKARKPDWYKRLVANTRTAWVERERK